MSRGHRWFAAWYDRLSAAAEASYMRPVRAEVAGGARGRVLEIGCGTGANFPYYDEAAQVTATEPDPYMLERARRRARALGHRLELVQAVAEALPFADGTFDCALAQLVFHFVHDRVTAAAEMRRVTRPGGRVAACVWDLTGGMAMLHAYWDAAREADPATPDERDRFGGRPGELARLWRDAGLREVEEGSLEVAADYAGFDELWGSFADAAGAVGAHLASLDEAGREAVRDAFRRRLGSPSGPCTLPARAWYAVGTV